MVLKWPFIGKTGGETWQFIIQLFLDTKVSELVEVYLEDVLEMAVL